VIVRDRFDLWYSTFSTPMVNLLLSSGSIGLPVSPAPGRAQRSSFLWLCPRHQERDVESTAQSRSPSFSNVPSIMAIRRRWKLMPRLASHILHQDPGFVILEIRVPWAQQARDNDRARAGWAELRADGERREKTAPSRAIRTPAAMTSLTGLNVLWFGSGRSCVTSAPP
jgi:hypothetical protein